MFHQNGQAKKKHIGDRTVRWMTCWFSKIVSHSVYIFTHPRIGKKHPGMGRATPAGLIAGGGVATKLGMTVATTMGLQIFNFQMARGITV